MLALWLSLTGQALAVSPDEPIAGVSPITAAQLEAELNAINPYHQFPGIGQLYVEWGYRFGLRADVAFAQMLHETNYLKFTGVCSPQQNNFAGIGATGGDNPGNSYASPELGVIGHYAHLAWYVYPDHRNDYCNSNYDPRHFGTEHRNSAHIIRELGGQWAVPGDGYGEALARIATQMWNRTPSGHMLGSFNEVLGTPPERLDTSYYFTWYDAQPRNMMAGNWIMIGNQGTGTARVRITIGGQVMRDVAHPENDFFSIAEGSRIYPSFYNLMAGPVKVDSLDGQPLIASQRVLFRDSFNEVLGIPAGEVSDSYEFTWYDSLRENGMAGNWVLVSNVGAAPADVEISIGENIVAVFDAAHGNALAPGAIVTPQFNETIGGPVRVRSTNGQPLIASQRVLYRGGFTELMGVPTQSLASDYLFTWYDTVCCRNWVLVTNRGSEPADVDVYVAGQLRARYNASQGNAIAPGSIVTPYFTGLTDGPVRVLSTNGQPLMASQRVLFRDSLEEVQGAPPDYIRPEQLFTWYDSKLVNYMRGNWILVANQGTETANVEIYIGALKMNDPEHPGNGFFTIPPGGRITPQFENLMGGPVRVVSTNGQALMVSQRVLFKDGLSR